MSVEGVQQFNNQAYSHKTTKQNVNIPKEVNMPGVVKDVSIGGLATVVASGLKEIKQNLEKKLTRTKKKISSGLLSMLGVEGNEGEEEQGGLDTVKKGLKEIFKNMQRKLNMDDQ